MVKCGFFSEARQRALDLAIAFGERHKRTWVKVHQPKLSHNLARFTEQFD